jgi:hypothetical protein
MATDQPPVHLLEQVKHLFDWISISTVVATLIGWLPSVAAALSATWYTLRIYETETVQRWLGKNTTRRTREDIDARH